MATTDTTTAVKSFTKTPQAACDVYDVLESDTGDVLMDVMSNDLGGAAKTLWSLDDGDCLADLLIKETVESVPSTSDMGVTITIVDGQVRYDLSSMPQDFRDALEGLAEGEIGYDSFTYAIRLGNGTLSWATVWIKFTGTNDAPVLTIDTSGGVTEDAATPDLTDSGALSFIDVDATDTHTVTAAYNDDAAWSDGILTATQAAAFAAGFSVDSTGWDYTIGNADVQFLGAGETITLTFDVTVTDDSETANNSDTETVTITITGTNDAPVLTVDTSGGATEDDAATLTDNGTLSFTDADVNDGHTVTSSSTGATWSGGPLSAGQTAALIAGFSAGVTGWTYSVANADVQFLADGETITLTFDVTVTDDSGTSNAGDTETVTITITGTNDAPVLTVDTSGGVIEDAHATTLTDSGTLSVTDADVTDGHSFGAVNTGVVWSDGILTPAQAAAFAAGFSVDGTGWDYAVANADVQFLGDGETITLTFDVTVTDDSGTGNAGDTETVTITITGTNDAPVLTVDTTGGAAEDAHATTLTDSGTLSVTDADVTDGHSFGAANTGVVWSGGILTPAQAAAFAAGFSVDGTGWDYAVANADVQFLGDGETITLTFDVTVTDDSGTGNADDTETVTITITGTNDAPVLTVDTSGGTTEDDAATLTDSGTLSFTDADVNDGHLVSSSSTGVVWSGGVLTPAQAAAFAAGFSVDGTGWDYAVANADVQFLADGETITLTFDVTVTDDSGTGNASDTETVTVVITGTNDAPVLTVDTSGGATEDAHATTLTDSGTLSVADADVTDSHSFGAVNTGVVWSDGTLTPAQAAAFVAGFSVDGTGWDYAVANADVQFLGDGETITLTFDVTVTDDSGTGNAGDTETVTITITGTNDAPVLTVDTSGGATEDDAATLTDSGTLSFTDADVNDGHLISSSSTGVVWSGGVLTPAQAAAFAAGFSVDGTGWDYAVANADVQFLADGETITLTFDVTVTDDSGTGNAGDTETVTITITGTNDDPVLTVDTSGGAAEDDHATTLTDSGALSVVDPDATDTHTVTASNTGVTWSGGALTPAQVAAFAAGFSVDGTGWDYAVANADVQFLADGESITLTFDVTADDGSGALNDSDTETVTIVITGTNDAPVINELTSDVSPSGDEDTAINGTIVATDDDATDTLAYSVPAQGAAGGPVNGTVTIGSNGAYTYTPDANWYGSDSFTVTVSDGNGGLDTVVVNVTVDPVNDGPVGVDDLTSTNEDTPLVLNAAALLANDTDIENDTLSITAVGNPTNGTVSLSAGQITFTPAANYYGPASFEYTVSDGDLTDTVLVNVTVNPVNDPAVFTGDVSGSVTEAGPAGPGVPSVSGDLNSTDVDNTADAFQAVSVAAESANGYGTYTVTAAGVWTYNLDNSDAAVEALNNGGTLSDSFTVLSEDGTPQVVSITINGTTDNAAPNAVNDLLYVNNGAGTATFSAATFLGNDTDPESDALQITGVTAVTGGITVTYNPTTNTISYMGNAGSFTYTVTDAYGNTDTATVTVQLAAATGSGNDQTYSLGGAYQGSYIDAGTGTDSITGGVGIDTFVGGLGQDTLVGGVGDDRLIGGANKDTLTGNGGADTFVYTNNITGPNPDSGLGAAADVIADFVHGTDKIDLSAIDANTALTNDQAFGPVVNLNGVQANTVTWFFDGTNTHVWGDVNGNTTADFEIILTGNVTLSDGDFIL